MGTAGNTPQEFDMMAENEVIEVLKSIFINEYHSFWGNEKIAESLFIEPSKDLLQQFSSASHIEETSSFFDELYRIILEENSCYSYAFLGDVGSGKTTIALELCKFIWDLDLSPTYLPIYINLSYLESIPTSFSNCLVLFASHHSIDPQFLTSRNLLLILDGFENVSLEFGTELEISENFNGTIIHFLRPDRFSSLVRKNLFKIGETNNRECFLQDFSEIDIDNYLKKFQSFLAKAPDLENTHFEQIQKDYKAVWSQNPQFEIQNWMLNEIPNLDGLGKNPLMLSLIVQVIPSIVLNHGGLDSWEIQSKIYDQVTTRYFQLLINRWVKIARIKTRTELDISPENLLIYCESFAINCAQTLIRNMDTDKKITLESFQDINFLEPIQNPEFLQQNWKNDREIFKTYPNYFKLIQQSFPGKFCEIYSCYRFSHYSLMEYFGDKELFGGLLGEFEKYDRYHCLSPESRESLLNHNLIVQVNMIKLCGMAQWLTYDENENAIKLLFNIISASKDKPFLRILAANAITILNIAGISLSGKDFRFIQIPHANLSNSLCGNTDFRGADLTNVSFHESWLTHCNFEGANFNNVKIGIQQHFNLENKIPSQIEFWKNGISLFIFIKFSNEDKNHFKVYKFNCKTGQVVNSKKPYTIRTETEVHGSGFQIIENYIALWSFRVNSVTKIKVIDLFSNKIKTCSISEDDDSVSCQHISLRDSRQTSLSDFGFKPIKRSLTLKRLKVNQTGQFVALRSDSSPLHYLHLFKIDIVAGTSQIVIKISCEVVIFALDFTITTCIFLFEGGLGIIELENPQNSLKVIKDDTTLKRILDHKVTNLETTVQFAIDPNNPTLMAIFGTEGKLSEKLFVINIQTLEIEYDLDKDTNMANYQGTKSVRPLTTLVYCDKILACVTDSLGQQTSTIRVWRTNDYDMIWTETFTENIGQIALCKVCEGIYELGILSEDSPNVRSILITSTDSIDTEELVMKSIVVSKFSFVPPGSRVQRNKISPDLSKLIIVLFEINEDESVNNDDNQGIKHRVEVWDLIKGKQRLSFSFISKNYFVDWIADDKLILTTDPDTEKNVTIYTIQKDFEYEEQSWTISSDLLPNFRHFDKIGDTIFAREREINTGGGMNIELIQLVLSDTISFQKILNFQSDSMPRYYPICRFIRHSNPKTTFIKVWDLKTMEVVAENDFIDFSSLIFDSVKQNILVLTTTNELWIWKIDHPQKITPIKDLADSFACITHFEPNSGLFITNGESRDRLVLWKFPENDIKATIQFWFNIESMHFLKSDDLNSSTIRILILRATENEIMCVEFDSENNYHWSLAWGKISFTDFKMGQTHIKNVINMNDFSDKIIKGHGAEGVKSIKRENYVSKGDLIYPMLGTAHLSKISKFSNVTFNENEWIVSAIALKTPSSGMMRREHLCLVVEGERNSRIFTFRADLFANAYGPFIQTQTFKSLEEVDDEFVKKEGVTKKWIYFQKKILKDLGDKLIDSILVDRRVKYTFFGDNCVQWCEDKLKVIGAHFEKSFWDFVKRAKSLRTRGSQRRKSV